MMNHPHQASSAATSQRHIIAASSWQGKAIPEMQWLVENWVPMGTTTALYGDGGTGKTLLAQQLMTCVAAGINFLGMPTAHVPTLGVFCEDDKDELHRRQVAINAHYSLDFGTLTNMYLESGVGMDNALTETIQEKLQPTAYFDSLRQTALKLGVKFVIVDTAADTFTGNENNRQEVRFFVQQILTKLAHDIGGTVLLCAHPSNHGMANGTGSGGSTAWNNSVRSRIYLSRPDTKACNGLSEADSKNLREFTKMKSNYSAIGEKFILRWVDGVLVVEQGVATDIVSQLARKKRDSEDEEIFLSLLDRLTKQGRSVSNSKNAGSNYAPKVMSAMDKETNIGITRFTEAMERLFNANAIYVGYTGIKGADRKNKVGIRRRPDDFGEVQHG